MEHLKEDSNLKIGEVVYILSNKNQNVIPALVVEESTIKTLQGTSTSWKLQIGPGEKAKIVDSTRIDGEIFTNLEIVKETLTKRLNEYINNLISSTKQKQENWYGKVFISSISNLKKEEKQTVKKELTKQELREELKKKIIPNDDDNAEETLEDPTIIPTNIDDFIHHNSNG